MMHTGLLRSEVFQVWAEGRNAADLVQLHFQCTVLVHAV